WTRSSRCSSARSAHRKSAALASFSGSPSPAGLPQELRREGAACYPNSFGQKHKGPFLRACRRVEIVFAIIQAGGRQLKVNPGSVVTLDRVEAEVGKEITFDQVLFLEKDGGEMLAGAPFVANAKVVGIVDGESRGPK